jgi:hypothetical protein
MCSVINRNSTDLELFFLRRVRKNQFYPCALTIPNDAFLRRDKVVKIVFTLSKIKYPVFMKGNRR